MMKQHGIATDGSGTAKGLLYQGDSRSFRLGEPGDRLQGRLSAVAAGSSWKWHTSCPKSGYEADGEADFLDSENYTVKSTSVSKMNDKVRNSSTTITAKWLGSDCGDVKPFEPKP